jgi:hypothetical protein
MTQQADGRTEEESGRRICNKKAAGALEAFRCGLRAACSTTRRERDQGRGSARARGRARRTHHIAAPIRFEMEKNRPAIGILSSRAAANPNAKGVSARAVASALGISNADGDGDGHGHGRGELASIPSSPGQRVPGHGMISSRGPEDQSPARSPRKRGPCDTLIGVMTRPRPNHAHAPCHTPDAVVPFRLD